MELQKIYRQEPIIINENEKILSNNENNIIEHDKRKIIVLHPKTKKENIIYLEEYYKDEKFCAEIIEDKNNKFYLKVIYYNRNKQILYELEE